MKLIEVLEVYAESEYSWSHVTCPVCRNETLVLGETVWPMGQVTPDTCNICGYLQGNGTDRFPGNFKYVRDCWELQIAPYRELDLDNLRTIKGDQCEST